MDKPYHITITNRVTGEAVVDVDTNGIAAAVIDGDGVRSICVTECNTRDMVCLACRSTDVSDVLTQHREVRKYVRRYKIAKFFKGGVTCTE